MSRVGKRSLSDLWCSGHLPGSCSGHSLVQGIRSDVQAKWGGSVWRGLARLHFAPDSLIAPNPLFHPCPHPPSPCGIEVTRETREGETVQKGCLADGERGMER